MKNRLGKIDQQAVAELQRLYSSGVFGRLGKIILSAVPKNDALANSLSVSFDSILTTRTDMKFP